MIASLGDVIIVRLASSCALFGSVRSARRRNRARWICNRVLVDFAVMMMYLYGSSGADVAILIFGV